MRIRKGWNELGRSREDRPISAYAAFDLDDSPREWTLLLGGTHGDERATVSFLETFVAERLEGREGELPVLAIPALNPDGYERRSRYNARGVDLNRNLPEAWSADSVEPPGPGPLSEPESRLLHDLLIERRPSRILSLHWALSEIDADAAGHAWARELWEGLEPAHRALFRLRKPGGGDGGALPGSLGTFCREALPETALVTLELPYHPEPELDPLPENHFEVAGDLWEKDRNRYWNGVYPAVESLLLRAAEVSP